MPKVTIKQGVLNAALGKVARTVPMRAKVPILKCVLLSLEEEGIRLCGTDLDIATEVQAAATHDGAGPAIAIVASLFADLVADLPASAEISISWSDNARVDLKCGRSRYKLNCLPREDWPSFSASSGDIVSFEVPADQIRRALAMSSHCMSTEETRFYLNGVALQLRGKDLLYVSTDGHRLARFSTPAPPAAKGLPDVIIPSRAVSELSRLMGKSDDNICIRVSAARISFSWAGITLESKLIDATYPDYQRVIPSRNDQTVLLDATDLLAAVNRLKVIARAVEKNQTSTGLKFSFDDDALTISTQNASNGDGEEFLKADVERPFRLQIGFNPAYVAGVIQTLATDVVRLRLGDPASPAIFEGHGHNDVLFVVMPLRV